MKKAQTVTEYLVLLAVAIIIALIIIGIIGGILSPDVCTCRVSKETVGREICSELNLTYDGPDNFHVDSIRCKTNLSIIGNKYNLTKRDQVYSVQVDWNAYVCKNETKTC